MKKILVIGCPGSGKSVFSRKLHQFTGIPLIHLDNLYWNKDRTTVPKEEFLLSLQSVLDGDEWIIDGNYISTMQMRLAKCDTVFFFDLPTAVCLEGIKSRVGKTRPDIPWVETEVDAEFERFVMNFNNDTRHLVVDLLEHSSGIKSVRFKSREDVDNYIKTIKNEQF